MIGVNCPLLWLRVSLVHWPGYSVISHRLDLYLGPEFLGSGHEEGNQVLTDTNSSMVLYPCVFIIREKGVLSVKDLLGVPFFQVDSSSTIALPFFTRFYSRVHLTTFGSIYKNTSICYCCRVMYFSYYSNVSNLVIFTIRNMSKVNLGLY